MAHYLRRTTVVAVAPLPRWAQNTTLPACLNCIPAYPVLFTALQDVASLGMLAERLEGDKAELEAQLAEAREAQVGGWVGGWVGGACSARAPAAVYADPFSTGAVNVARSKAC